MDRLMHGQMGFSTHASHPIHFFCCNFWSGKALPIFIHRVGNPISETLVKESLFERSLFQHDNLVGPL